MSLKTAKYGEVLLLDLLQCHEVLPFLDLQREITLELDYLRDLHLTSIQLVNQ